MTRRRNLDLADSEEMDRFFDQLDRMGEAELMRLRAAWLSIDRQAHEDAWAVVRVVCASGDLDEEIEKVRDRALTWVRYDGMPYRYLDGNPMWMQHKADAAEAVVDAAIGVALGDRLDRRTRATLLAAWAGIEPLPGRPPGSP
jgi:tellurite resistance protein